MARNPKPPLIREIEGNRGKRAIPESPQGIGEPVCNPNLSTEEQRFWWAIVDSLPPGLLTRADENALERMAVAWARFWDCRAKIKEIGLMVKGPNGATRNPLLIVERDAREEMHRAGEVLGLSPVARARITLNDGSGGEDPTEVLLGGFESGAFLTGGENDTSVVPFKPRAKKK